LRMTEAEAHTFIAAVCSAVESGTIPAAVSIGRGGEIISVVR
jgi:hypothetical protein